ICGADDWAVLGGELERISAELASDTFPWPEGAEDVHSAVEQVLQERAGPIAGKLHTARSRNDQVALDLRLLVIELLDELDGAVLELAQALVDRAAGAV